MLYVLPTSAVTLLGVHMLPMRFGNISIYSQSDSSLLVISFLLVPDPVVEAMFYM
jgi:hypothetical protein